MTFERFAPLVLYCTSVDNAKKHIMKRGDVIENLQEVVQLNFGTEHKLVTNIKLILETLAVTETFQQKQKQLTVNNSVNTYRGAPL